MQVKPAILTLVAVLVTLACTPVAQSGATVHALRAAAPLAPVTSPSGVVVTATPRYLAGSQHAAFPGLAPTPSGLTLVWRQGSDHYLKRDGAILSATGDQDGRTFSPPTTVLAGGTDYRDPSVSYIAGHQYLTFFTGSAALEAQGAFVSRDGGAAVRIDTLPYAAISAPVVALPDGRLGVAFYGRKAGETLVTAWMGWSSDLGRTWSTNRIINSGVATPEPYLVVDGGTVHMFARWGSSAIAVRDSADSGRTFPAGPRVIVTDCTGRPGTIRTQDGTLIMICRGPLSQGKHAVVVYSLDHAATWTAGPIIMTAPAGSPNGMTYAAMAETLPGVVYTVVGMEQADGTSALYSTRLAVSVR